MKRERSSHRPSLPWLAPVLFLLALALLVAACSTVPDTGRQQFNPFSTGTESRMGLSEFNKIKQSKTISKNPTYNAQVQRVAKRLIPVVPIKNAQWEFVVFEDPSPNAFALPGGKVGVHTGLFQITQGEAGLATVIGHELGHIVARHSGERLTQTIGAAVLTGVVNQAMKDSDSRTAATAATGAATGLTVLKFSRGQELEADQLGALYMARAGYDPAESVAVWQRFAAYKNAQGKNRSVAFLSTHPLDSTRIAKLQAFLPRAQAEYRAGRGGGAAAPAPASPSAPATTPALPSAPARAPAPVLRAQPGNFAPGDRAAPVDQVGE